MSLCLSQLDSCQASTSGAFSGDRVRAANVAERVRYLTLSQTLFECRVSALLNSSQVQRAATALNREVVTPHFVLDV